MPPLSINHAYNYVKQLLSKLPGTFCFHNWNHTLLVFDLCCEMGKVTVLNEHDFHALQLAALFHDSGYLYQYEGHEDRSIFLAGVYLKNRNYGADTISKVVGCINATRVLQSPNNVLEQIICDADLSHFASRSYPELADALKHEWELILGRTFDPAEWTRENLYVLNRHTYFTDYGKNILQPLKEKNIKILENKIDTINP